MAFVEDEHTVKVLATPLGDLPKSSFLLGVLGNEHAISTKENTPLHSCRFNQRVITSNNKIPAEFLFSNVLMYSLTLIFKLLGCDEIPEVVASYFGPAYVVQVASCI